MADTWRHKWGLFVGIVAVGIAAILAAAAPSAPSTTQEDAKAQFKRDWQAYPAVVELRTDNDVYAIGDMHGDYDKAVKLLAGAGLIAGVPALPKDAKWAGGKSLLVCTGDMIDKWNQGLEIIQLMRALQADAQQSGGRVVVTLGNHEAEFLASRGDKKKAAEFSKELLEKGIEPSDVAGGNDAQGIGAWLRDRPIAAKINDCFFCHAGNTFGMSLKDEEQAVESGVDKDGFGAFVLSEPNSILEARLNPVPWWIMAAQAAANKADPTRQNPTEPGAATLRRYVAALGCSHLVIGHQPGKVNFGGGVERKAGAPFAYEGLLFLMDVGMSRGVQDSRGIVLKVHGGPKEHVDTVDESGRETLLWAAE